MTDESLMPYGKFKGYKMANVPPEYLLWLFDNTTSRNEVYTYIEANLDVLKFEVKQKQLKK